VLDYRGYFLYKSVGNCFGCILNYTGVGLERFDYCRVSRDRLKVLKQEMMALQ